MQWSLYFLVHEDVTSTKITAGCHPATLLDALRSKSTAACLDTWRTSFAHPSSQGRHFLPLKGGIKNLLQPSYAKGGGWLSFIGELVTLCVMKIEWDYSYYQPWSDNEWLVDEIIAMREEMLMVQNKDITMQ